MTNYENYMNLLKAENVILDEMLKLECYSDEWNKLDAARKVLSDLESKFR